MARLVGVFCTLGLVLGGPAVASTVGDGSLPAPASITRRVTHLPQQVLDRVGAGPRAHDASFSVSKLHGSTLRTARKPELLATIYTWCPHCAANSWSLAVALSRFGALSGLRISDTGTLYPQFHHTHSLSFWRARFKSRFLSFVPVVLQNAAGQPVESETSSEHEAISSFDPNGTPAIDVGGRWGFLGSEYSPGVLAGKSWLQIAGDLAKSGTLSARSVDGQANLFSAAICTATGGHPRAVCESRGVAAARRHLR